MCEKKLKVIHISTTYFGGAGTAAFRIHLSLLKSGIDSSFISSDEVIDPTLKGSTKFQEKKRSVFFANIFDKIKWRLKNHFNVCVNEKDALTRKLDLVYPKLNCEIASLPHSDLDILNNPLVHNADIIHMHWVAGTIDYPSFFKKNGKPLIWTLHDMNPFQGLFHYEGDKIRNEVFTDSLDVRVKSLKNRAIKMRNAKLMCIAPSVWLMNEAKNSEIFKDVSLNCISNPIDTNLFSRCTSSDFRDKYDIPQNNTVFLFVAQAVDIHRKGFDLLIDALKILKNFPVTLLVLGESKVMNIEGVDIRQLGCVKDNGLLSYFYSNSDAFILPSREDNLPNVMLESLSCGTPVIGYNIGGLRDHITDFKTGLLAKDISSESLASSIEIFCKYKSMFSSLEISNYARKYFDETIIANKYIEIYNQILNKN